jgi:hypothetical protein
MLSLRALVILPLLLASWGQARAESDWKVYDCPAGRFSVSAPGQPEEITEHNDTPLGRVDEHTLSWRSGDLEWVVEYTDVPDAATTFNGAILFAQARRGFQKTTGQPVKNEKKLVVGPYPGRTFLVDHRLYVLTVTWDKASLPADRDAANRFFESFKLAGLNSD